MENVRAEYIVTDLDDRLDKGMNALIRTIVSRRAHGQTDADPLRKEARAIVVVGEAGTGKTVSIERLFRTHPALKGYGHPGSGCPLISVTVPAPCTLKSLGMSILHALGYPLARDLREYLLWARVHEALKTAGILLLHLDELHNLTDNANVLEIDTIRKAMKSIMVSNEWPVGLVISGLPSLVPAMREIDEVRRRGRFIQLPQLSMPADTPLIAETLSRCCSVASIATAEGFAEAIGPRLGHAALNRYGIAVELIHEAIEDCLISADDELQIAHFANAFADRTGCGDRMNPFIAPDWYDIDASLILLDEMPPEPILAGDPKPKSSGRNSPKRKK
ncbi:MAG TPA: ATP-binding protein [Bosea sp. (in: a-proteobacteria)]|jgi:hypothetical protein|nr:ATP-binding protein [Bosea sp. (in: a-proteobacteria)]